MAVLFNAGLHVPVILLLEVVGSGDNKSPVQIGSIKSKVGVTLGITVRVIVVVVAH